MVAIDFTGSNGDPSDPSSLHHIDLLGRTQNQYILAIDAIGQLLTHFSKDQQYPVYGFGGRAPGGLVNHCFALNGNDASPYVTGINGIKDAYSKALKIIQLSGPTIFSNVIAQASAFAASFESAKEQKYMVLLIITDGIINDEVHIAILMQDRMNIECY